MKRKFILLFVFIGVVITTILLTSFNKSEKVITPYNVVKKEQFVIRVTPLGDVNNKHLELVKTCIEKFYGFKCILDNKEPLTKDLLAKSKTRYEANKIIAKYKSNKNILLVTNVDIAHFNRVKKIKEYGIIGLGYRPGTTCVVSTFRIKNTTKEKFTDRLIKVTLHEVGHNLGIPHCTFDKKCLMNDANGTVKQIDQEKIWLCDNCKKIIGKR
jgi:archaemetzincin